jgi:histidinol dehydrogenase
MKLAVIDLRTADAATRCAALARPANDARDTLLAEVRVIVDAVRTRGDAALREYATRFDGHASALAVDAAKVDAAVARLPAAALAALQRAIDNVRRFHAAQMPAPLAVETAPGVLCERVVRPLDSVGLYVPAGSAPLPSALVMSAVPATLAGCRRIVLCTPARNGAVDIAILAAARLCGITEIFAVGGAQAIAAMAYGTETIPKVDKIVGPGSAWVTAAKQIVAADPTGAALDLPAGPSEVLVIADAAADAEFVAADLLAQAEHDVLAQAILVTPDAALASAVQSATQRQLERLSRRDILEQSLQRSRILLVADLDAAFALSNEYAPEHLILQIESARARLADVRAAGSVFLGAWSPESIGDYCSGTNHVLPTYGYARAYSGLSLADFQRRITVQELTPAGLEDLGPVATTLAGLEGLDAHAAAVTVRLNAIAGRTGAAS